MKTDILLSKIAVVVDRQIAKIESINMKKKAIRESGSTKVILDKLKAFDKKAKALAKKATQLIKNSLNGLDTDDACSICTAVSKSPVNSDDATRQRYQRRRNILKVILAEKFTDYDFHTSKRNNRAYIQAEWIGNANQREVNQILSDMRGFQDMGLLETIPNIEDIRHAVEASNNTAVITIALQSVDDGLPSVLETSEEMAIAINDGIISQTRANTITANKKYEEKEAKEA